MHVDQINVRISQGRSPFTRQGHASATRCLLVRLHEDHNAPPLARRVLKTASARPRNVTATASERRTILAAAPPHLRCWLLLCSDLAIRSGTAARICPDDYDPQTRVLTFTTKYDARQNLKVTSELAAILGTRGLRPAVPYVAQLPRIAPGQKGYHVHNPRELTPNGLSRAFKKLRERIGITRKLTAHDLRRTTATRIYDQTHDLRVVQALLGHSDLSSTLWYLDHHIKQVPVPDLELAKLNPTTEVIQ